MPGFARADCEELGGNFPDTPVRWKGKADLSALRGQPIVLHFTGRGAKLYARGGYQVDSTNSDQDDFIKNKFTIRVERRVVEGTTYPEFFVAAAIGSS